MQKIKLKTEESGKKLLAAYAPPKWSETADDDDEHTLFEIQKLIAIKSCNSKLLCQKYIFGAESDSYDDPVYSRNFWIIGFVI